MEYKIIKTDGSTVLVKPIKGKFFSLDEMQKIVGGLIQLLYLPDGDIMVANEEGKLLALPYNKEATELLAGSNYVGDFICGDVLLTDYKAIK